MEMEQSLAQDSSPTRRDGRVLTRCPNLEIMRSLRAVEAIKLAHDGRVIACDDENGVLRVKILVPKQQLTQMVASTGQGQSVAGLHRLAARPPSVDQLLHALRRRHTMRAEATKGYQNGWRPALQSIPEEN